MDLKPLLRRAGWIVRGFFTFLFALLVLGVMVWAYVQGFQLVSSQYGIIAFGFYGLLLGLSVLFQSIFAYVEHRRMRARKAACTLTKTIGLTISAYQEDPAYLRECLHSIRGLNYPTELLRIIMVVDGNSEADLYMLEMFREVFADQDPGCYVWSNNYHTWDPTREGGVATANDPGGDAGMGEDPQSEGGVAGANGPEGDAGMGEDPQREGGVAGAHGPGGDAGMGEDPQREGGVAGAHGQGGDAGMGEDPQSEGGVAAANGPGGDAGIGEDPQREGGVAGANGQGGDAGMGEDPQREGGVAAANGQGGDAGIGEDPQREGGVAAANGQGGDAGIGEDPQREGGVAAANGPGGDAGMGEDPQREGGVAAANGQGGDAGIGEDPQREGGVAAANGQGGDAGMEEDPQRREVEDLINSRRCVCIMQKWGGKREVMYTAFKALGSSVDYIQVCDSDTKLDTLATLELCKVLESDPSYGAVGGDVMILNLKESYISFMSSLRYWMAFNIERACQSFFNCVSCISGPLGLYRNDLLQQFLESWYNQMFLGTHCTFGDDRHLTNRMLSMGYATKYTARSKCYTETPAQFLRWLSQQTRWTKSYFREWLYNAMWWHKHHLWMTYEAIISGVFPFFVTATIIQLFWTGTLWDILWVLCCIQLIGLVKAAYACLLRKDVVMVFMSLYSALYMTSLLPAKYFAILTMNKSSWGTSGRLKMVGNYIPLLPLSVWAAILLSGLSFTIYKETQKDWNSAAKIEETKFLIFGSVAYVCYWLFMVILYWVWFRRACRKRSQSYNVSV